jgi:hypothetical protein
VTKKQIVELSKKNKAEIDARSPKTPASRLRDVNEVAFASRIDRFQGILVEAGFPTKQIGQALNGPDPQTKEELASWLIAHLSYLGGAEKKVGTSPVFVGGALPRPMVADLALTMLECLDDYVGPNLIDLFSVLLKVDRHRNLNASQVENDWRFGELVSLDARTELEGKRRATVREMGRTLEVSPTTISEWRGREGFPQLLEEQKHVWIRKLSPFLQAIRATDLHLNEFQVFQKAFHQYADATRPRE